MRKEIGILLAWVVFLSGCVGKPMEKQNEQTNKERRCSATFVCPKRK